MNAPSETLAKTPTLNAEQALTRLLSLIRDTRSAEELSPERLAAAFGVKISQYEPGYWAFGEALSPRWSYSIELREKIKIGSRFNFSFNSAAGASPPIDELCALDYAGFTAQLESMGFVRTAYRAEHGRFVNDWFDRPGLRLAVHPLGEPRPADGKAARVCVKMVLIP
ncbi:hypothetical protein [Pseudomonas sp. CGJS7]|uniref:hypothetical protein n=1 Tax=Pseudomonas sp. CGJS7 TaxID=3109348 RepID=UPI00300B6696